MTIIMHKKCVTAKNGVFKDRLFVLETGTSSYKYKQDLRSKITKNGGTISYLLTKKSHYVVSQPNTDTYKTRRALKLGIPVVSSSYIDACIHDNTLLDTDDYALDGATKSKSFKKGKIKITRWGNDPVTKLAKLACNIPTKFKSESKKCPKFTESFRVAKFFILQGTKSDKNEQPQTCLCVYELHIADSGDTIHVDSEAKYRVIEHWCDLDQGSTHGTESFEYFFDSCADALVSMQSLVTSASKTCSMKHLDKMPVDKLGSFKLRQLLDEMGATGGTLHPQVAKFISELLALVFNNLNFDPRSLSPDQITKAVVALVKIPENLLVGKSTEELSSELYSILPWSGDKPVICNMKLLSNMRDTVQLMKDSILMVETFNSNLENWDDTVDIHDHEVASFYRALKCAIWWMDPDEAEHQEMMKLLHQSKSLPNGFKVVNIFRVHREIEDANFTHNLGEKRLLFHASKPQNFFGILSRGLLPPLVVTSVHGGDRSDEGNLGSGLYFADDVSTSARYSNPNPKTGTRLLLINEVALGRIYKSTKRDVSLTAPPNGHDSVKAVGKCENVDSEFSSNEYVVYNTDQQRMRFLVEFVLEGDQVIEKTSIAKEISLKDPETLMKTDSDVEKVSLEDVTQITDPIELLKPGLNIQGSEDQIPLEELHVRSKMIDMVAEVVVLQQYTNTSTATFEAKYVFPLDDSAAVCGFEAFINGKHVIGKVKEKEVAHKEYKEAVAAGHGAYLMDEEKADVFTISIGNLPPKAKVVIKITYVAELSMVSNNGLESIQFKLPGSIAPNVRENTLIKGPVTQYEVDRVTVQESAVRKSSLVLSIEMPFSIRKLECTTHKVLIKQTDTKATIRLANNEQLGGGGFNFLVGLAEVHVPRMWVEEDDDGEGAQACMLAFYPEFEVDPVTNYRAIILIDMSQSMKGEGGKLETYSKKISLMILKQLPKNCLVNIVKFGSSYQELFVYEQVLSENVVWEKSVEFIQSCYANMGASEAWRPLTSLSWVNDSEGTDRLSNIFLVSDGQLGEEKRTLDVAANMLGGRRKFASRVFTFSLGTTANQYLLKKISRSTGGSHEHFAFDAKSKWERKVSQQLEKAQQPVLTDIKVNWKTYNENEETQVSSALPKQAPEYISSLFNQSRVVVYGFVPHCRQAELSAKICGKEISTVVSVSELSVTKGKTLHHLTSRALIRDYEDGLHHLSPLERADAKKLRKPHIIEMSVKHSVVSPYTSFVAVEERKKDEVISKGLSITELLDEFMVDLIPEIGWESEDQDMPAENIEQLLKSAETAYYRSVRESVRIFEAAEEMAYCEDKPVYWQAQIITTMLKLGLDVKISVDFLEELRLYMQELEREEEGKGKDLVYSTLLHNVPGFDQSIDLYTKIDIARCLLYTEGELPEDTGNSIEVVQHLMLEHLDETYPRHIGVFGTEGNESGPSDIFADTGADAFQDETAVYLEADSESSESDHVSEYMGANICSDVYGEDTYDNIMWGGTSSDDSVDNSSSSDVDSDLSDGSMVIHSSLDSTNRTVLRGGGGPGEVLSDEETSDNCDSSGESSASYNEKRRRSFEAMISDPNRVVLRGGEGGPITSDQETAKSSESYSDSFDSPGERTSTLLQAKVLSLKELRVLTGDGPGPMPTNKRTTETDGLSAQSSGFCGQSFGSGEPVIGLAKGKALQRLVSNRLQVARKLRHESRERDMPERGSLFGRHVSSSAEPQVSGMGLQRGPGPVGGKTTKPMATDQKAPEEDFGLYGISSDDDESQNRLLSAKISVPIRRSVLAGGGTVPMSSAQEKSKDFDGYEDRPTGVTRQLHLLRSGSSGVSGANKIPTQVSAGQEDLSTRASVFGLFATGVAFGSSKPTPPKVFPPKAPFSFGSQAPKSPGSLFSAQSGAPVAFGAQPITGLFGSSTQEKPTGLDAPGFSFNIGADKVPIPASKASFASAFGQPRQQQQQQQSLTTPDSPRVQTAIRASCAMPHHPGFRFKLQSNKHEGSSDFPQIQSESSDKGFAQTSAVTIEDKQQQQQKLLQPPQQLQQIQQQPQQQQPQKKIQLQQQQQQPDFASFQSLQPPHSQQQLTCVSVRRRPMHPSTKKKSLTPLPPSLSTPPPQAARTTESNPPKEITQDFENLHGFAKFVFMANQEDFTKIRLIKRARNVMKDKHFELSKEVLEDDIQPYPLYMVMEGWLVEAGVRSLGKRIYSMVLKMLFTAFVNGILEEILQSDPVVTADSKLLEDAKLWLKQTDSKYPGLYARLELGASWPKAAENFVNKLMDKIAEDPRLNVEKMLQVFGYTYDPDLN